VLQPAAAVHEPATTEHCTSQATHPSPSSDTVLSATHVAQVPSITLGANPAEHLEHPLDFEQYPPTHSTSQISQLTPEIENVPELQSEQYPFDGIGW
jgi:hypothetical protein